jgi:GNAT superfamily N-acetyltransferase
MRIRELDPRHDLDFLRRCVLHLQEIERSLDPRLPEGAEMVEPYCATLLERCGAWDGVLLVAEEEDGPVGLLAMFLRVPQTEPDEPPGSYASVSDLVVLPEARGRGIGTVLLARAEERARSAGAATLRLEVMAGNRRARDFYRRHGWRDRVVQMEKPLPGTSPRRPPPPRPGERH